MSIYDYEITKLDCMLMAYVRIQNDFTGQIRGRVFTIRRKGGRDYVVADGQRLDVTNKVEEYRRRQERIDDALRWYKQTKF